MKTSYLLAATAALALMLQAPLALAQTAGGTAPAATTAAPAATTTTPAATTAAPATTAPAAADTTTPSTGAKKSVEKKPAKKKMTRQQEIDHSVDSGTVPARYRSSVPKQYQQYIPFDKQ